MMPLELRVTDTTFWSITLGSSVTILEVSFRCGGATSPPLRSRANTSRSLTSHSYKFRPFTSPVYYLAQSKFTHKCHLPRTELTYT